MTGRKLGQGDPVTSRSISSSKPAKSSVPPTTATTTTTANSTLASATASVSALSSSRTFGGLSQDAVERNNPVNPRGYRAPPDPELVLRQRRQREDSAIRTRVYSPLFFFSLFGIFFLFGFFFLSFNWLLELSLSLSLSNVCVCVCVCVYVCI